MENICYDVMGGYDVSAPKTQTLTISHHSCHDLIPVRMDISSALKVLRDATLDALWEHRQEIEITLVNISKRLRVSITHGRFACIN